MQEQLCTQQTECEIEREGLTRKRQILKPMQTKTITTWFNPFLLLFPFFAPHSIAFSALQYAHVHTYVLQWFSGCVGHLHLINTHFFCGIYIWDVSLSEPLAFRENYLHRCEWKSRNLKLSWE